MHSVSFSLFPQSFVHFILSNDKAEGKETKNT